MNQEAPDFALSDQNGQVHKLSDYAGKWVVVYFYPKDDTPGCTLEACGFRDNMEKLVEMGVVILGISRDPIPSHKKFAEKHKLNFPILSDPEHEVIQKYGAWGAKKFMGRVYEGIMRKTLLIDPAGIVVKIYEKVNPVNHAGEIIKDINSLVQ